MTLPEPNFTCNTIYHYIKQKLKKMKQFILSSFISMTFISGVAYSVSAQSQSDLNISSAGQNEVGFAKTDVKKTTDVASLSNSEDLAKAKSSYRTSKAYLKSQKANFRASRNFNDSYRNAQGVDWTKTENAMFATFKEDGVKTRVTYDKNGYWMNTLVFMPISKLPDGIYSIARNGYRKDKFNQAFHIRNREMEYYIIQTEDEKTFKQIAVYNDHLILIKKWYKI